MVGMDIPEEAVEAADKVFNDLLEIGQSFGPGYVREMLEAAAPHMTERAYNAGHLDGMTGAPNNNPYRSQS